MTNEIINIFTSKKIIAETLTNKFKSLYQININYFFTFILNKIDKNTL